MGFKDDLDREKASLISSRRPYETAAFLIFSLLFLRQIVYLIRSLYLFMRDGGNFKVINITVVGNLQAFFNRTISVGPSKWIYVILAVLLLGLYYFLIYIFVWRYCKKRNMAKWTWTTLVVFGPTLFIMPPYMFYIIYIFRQHFFKFIKIVIDEYKAFDPKEMAVLEAKLIEEENADAEARSIVRLDKEHKRAEVRKERLDKREADKLEKTEDKKEAKEQE